MKDEQQLLPPGVINIDFEASIKGKVSRELAELKLKLFRHSKYGDLQLYRTEKSHPKTLPDLKKNYVIIL